MFCKKGGYQHLFNSLLELPLTKLTDPFARECFWLLIVDLEIIMISGYPLEDYVKDYKANRDKMIKRILTIMDAYAKYPALINREQNEFKNSKETRNESEELTEFPSSIINGTTMENQFQPQ